MATPSSKIYISGLVAEHSALTGQIVHNLNTFNTASATCTVSETDSAIHLKQLPTALILPSAVSGKTIKVSSVGVSGALKVVASYPFSLSSQTQANVSALKNAETMNYEAYINAASDITELIYINGGNWHILGRITGLTVASG